MKSKKNKFLNKKTTYQIDQSIKIENTRKTSYVCLSNGKTIICSISAKDKRELKLFFRELEKPLIFKLFTFSVLCAKVIIKAKVNTVIIDTEYCGHEIDIKSFITQILIIWKYKETNISFIKIGKQSNAHIKGYKAYETGNKGVVVKAQEVLILYNKIDKP